MSLDGSSGANTSTTPSTNPRILFVCLGNICRSPLAEAVFRQLTSPTTSPSIKTTFSNIDSAGTGAYHALSPPDPRTISTLSRHGITDYTHKARKVRSSDFEDFDWIFAMDAENFEDLEELKDKLGRKQGPEKALARLMLFGACASGGRGKEGGDLVSGWEEGEGEEVVDPYYGGGEGFEIAYEQVVRFTEGFLRHLEDVNKDGVGRTDGT